MQFTYIGPQIEALLGWRQTSWLSANGWADRIHEEDRQKTVDFCVSQSQLGVDHEADYRALTKDGEYVWIRDVVHVVRSEDGSVEALVGFKTPGRWRGRHHQHIARAVFNEAKRRDQQSAFNIVTHKLPWADSDTQADSGRLQAEVKMFEALPRRRFHRLPCRRRPGSPCIRSGQRMQLRRPLPDLLIA